MWTKMHQFLENRDQSLNIDHPIFFWFLNFGAQNFICL